MRSVDGQKAADLICTVSQEYPNMFGNPEGPHEFELHTRVDALSVFGETLEDTLYTYIRTESEEDGVFHLETLLYQSLPTENNPGWIIEGEYRYTVDENNRSGTFEGSISLTNKNSHEEQMKTMRWMYAKRTANQLQHDITNNMNALASMVTMIDDPEEKKRIATAGANSVINLMRAVTRNKVEREIDNKGIYDG